MYASADGNNTRPRFFLPALLLVTVAAVGLRLYRLDAESLWMDELVTAETYPLSLPQIILKAADEGQPPLDNLIGAVLARLGLANSDWWVRFPAAIFGSGCVFLLGLWIGRIGGAWAGIGAAVLLTVCPLHVCMSQEVRPYAIFFFLALATILAFARARQRHTFVSWSVFGVVLFCLLMTRWTDPHFLTLGIVLYALCAFFIAQWQGSPVDRRNEKMKLWAAASAMGMAYAIYNPFFGIVLDRSLRAVAAQSTGGNSRMANQLFESFAALFLGYSTRTIFSSLPGNPSLLVAAVICSVLGLIVLTTRVLRRRDAGIALWLVTMLPFPLVYAWVFAHLGNAIPKPQYLLLGAAAVFGCLAMATDALRRRTLRFGRVVSTTSFVLVLGLFALPMAGASIRSLQSVDKCDWRGVMGYLKEHSGLQDAFAVMATDTVPPTFHVAVYGRARYGREDMKFLNIDLHTSIDGLKRQQWVRSDNIVWIVGYNDRMYLGFEQLPAPDSNTANVRVHAFNGLFIMEISPGERAVNRLMGGLALLSEQVPDGSSFIAPAVFRGGYLLSRGREEEAAVCFDKAIRQCHSTEEAAVLVRDYITPLRQVLAIRLGSSR